MRQAVTAVGKLIDSLGHLQGMRDADPYFHINLSRRYRPALAPLRTLVIACCAILTIGILWNIGQAIMGLQQTRTIEAELDRIRQQDDQLVAQARQEGIDLSDAALQRLPAEVDLANQLIEKRTFSWTKFLSGLEQVIPPSLALSSIRLDAGGTMVHLSGTAVSLEDITAFTVSLQDHPTFKDPVLAQHRAGVSGQVEFDITLHYRRDGA
jgi:Tfp pilus assembly protein PilN